MGRTSAGLMEIGPYIVEKEIGRGGMGVVYLAHDSRLKRRVAVKTLPGPLSHDPHRLARFRREALLLASLNHPNIAQIYSVEEHEGRQNLILEYVPGESLAERLLRGPLDVDTTLRLSLQIARAVEAAHRHGVIHRDLKPGNIRITDDGVAKVVDFGLAKSVTVTGLEPGADAGPPDADAGRILGTPAYMSPEQTRGGEVSRPSDLWAFGCVVYESLTGEAPFERVSIPATLTAVRNDTPDWSRLPAGTPEPVRRLLGRCLDKNVPSRISDAGRAAEIIEDALTGSSDRWVAWPGSEGAGNLPTVWSSFVGRANDVETLTAILGEAPMVTLTGPGGCGKTRLALEAAARVRAACHDGVWLVELEGLSDPDLLPSAVASIVGVEENADRTLAESIEEHFEDRAALLVLDNCEHLLEACASLVDSLLRRCPGLRILATSRRRLGIDGERIFSVPPLAVPEADAEPSLDAIAASEAVRLFVERAQAVRPSFTLDATNAETVATLCRRLDGMPLAIELAAARVRLLSPDQILDRLDERFRLLHAEGSPHTERHRTLEAAIDWSTRLLDECEQALLAALSVFAGSWTLDSAAAVCAPDLDEFVLLDRLTQLVDRSLVVVEEERPGLARRYRLLETMREYARRRLPAGAAAVTRRRHLDHFQALAERIEPRLRGRDQRCWLDRLEADHRNFLAALGRAAAAAEPATRIQGLRLAGALARFWQRRGHFALGLRCLDTALATTGDAAPSEARAKALDGSGALRWRLGDYAAARSMHDRARRIWEELGDDRGVASSLNGLGNLAYVQRRYGEARRFHEAALAIRRRLDDASGVAGSLTNLGNVAYEQGDYDSARRLHEEALAHARRKDDPWGIATALNNLGNVAFDLGDIEGARRLHEESLEIKQELGDRWGIGASLTNLGHAALEAGHAPAARRFYRKALGVWRRLGNAGEYAECLEAVACLAVTTDDAEQAARLLGAAERLRETIGSAVPANSRDRHRRCLECTRSALGDRRFDRHRREGSEQSAEDAVAETLAWLAADSRATLLER